MEKRKKLEQIGNIRALAIFLVVLGHSIILYSSSWSLYLTKVSVPVLDWLKRMIDIPQMPLFFSISGYLFAFSHKKKRGYGHLLKSKALRLLVPYLVIGTCYMLPIRLAVGYPSYRGMTMWEFARKMIWAEDVGHLWFLPALFTMFALSELMLGVLDGVPIVKKYSEYGFCVISALLYLEGYRIGFSYPPLLNSYNYMIWFAYGYFICVHQNWIEKTYAITGIKWLLMILNAFLLVYKTCMSEVGVLVSVGTVALCITNAYGMMPKNSCERVSRIDRNSFGIYLFHSPLIYVTFSLIPDAHPFVVVTMNLVVFGSMAYLLTVGIRKTKARFMIGE